MKVIHIHDLVNTGGSEMLTLDICKNVTENMFEVIFVSLKQGGTLQPEFEKLPSTKCVFLDRKNRFDITVILQLRKVIVQNDVKIIHSHSAIASLYVYFATLFLKVKHIYHVHGYSSKLSLGTSVSIKFAVRYADYLLTVSNSFRDILQTNKVFKGKVISIIPNGIAFSKLQPVKPTIRQELGLSDNTIIFGMVGSFNWGRDQLFICSLLPELLKKHPNAIYLFIGAKTKTCPEYYDRCIQFCIDNKINDRVYFLGKRTDVNALLDGIDYFLYATVNDSFGLAVVEAMYKNKPVIVNDTSPMLEITNQGKSAFVFKTLNKEDCLCKIEEALNNKNEIKTRDWVIEKYSIEKFIEELNTYYENII
jgi:glycosyltransferase involved in cell wall biosynthesis